MKLLRDAMRREAGRVWREKARAEAFGLFLNEETITESTLLNLATGFQGRGLFVRLFSKAEEKKNGADWEFWFAQRGKAVGLRVQAKRLFPKGAYNSLKPGGAQTKTLIKNAGNCYPVYAFFNDSLAYKPSTPKCSCREYRAESYLGITLASAAEIASSTSNSASTLQRHTIPWHCLLCKKATKKISLPETIEKNLNVRLVKGDPRRCEVVSTPSQFYRYVNVEGRLASEFAAFTGYNEPRWLAGYLAERMLAGIALFSATERA